MKSPTSNALPSTFDIPDAPHGLAPTFAHSHPPPLQPVVRPVHRRHIAAHGPGDHLAVQGNVVHLLGMLAKGGFDELFALGRVGLFAGGSGLNDQAALQNQSITNAL